MQRKCALVSKRKHDLNSKLKELKDEADSVVKYVENIIKRGTSLAGDLERETDNFIFLRRYPVVLKELDKLLNKIVQLNCSIGLGASEDETEEGAENDCCSTEQTLVKSAVNCERLTSENVIHFSAAHNVGLGNEIVQLNCNIGVDASDDEKVEDAENDSCATEQTLTKSAVNCERFTPENAIHFSAAHNVGLRNEIIQFNSDIRVCASREAEENAHELCVREQTFTKSAIHYCEQLTPEISVPFSDVHNFSPDIHDDSFALETTHSAPPKYMLPSCPVQQGDILDMSFLRGNSPYNFWLCSYASKLLDYLNDTLLSRYHHKQLYPVEVSSLDIGTYVCAFDGKKCFRGKVLKIRLQQPVQLMVLNVDSGRMQRIEEDRVFKLDEDLSEIPAQALNCRLHGDLGDPSLWNDQVTPLFYEVLTESTLVVTICGKVERDPPQFLVEIDCHNEKRISTKIELNKWIIHSVFPKLEEAKNNSKGDIVLKSLFTYLDPALRGEEQCTEEELYSENILGISSPSTQISDTCPSTLIMEHNQPHIPAERGPASVQHMKSTAQHGLMSEPAASPLDVNLPVNSHVTSELGHCAPQTVHHNEMSYGSLGVNTDVTGECTFHLPEEKNIFLHHSVHLSSAGRNYKAMLAHIEDPSEFYIHTVCEDNIGIDNLQIGMTQYYATTQVSFKSKEEAKCRIGLFCAAYYDDDEKWYRAKVIDWNQDSNSNHVNIKYVDYGNMALVHFSMLQPLRSEFAKLPICATKCSLAMIYPPMSTQDKISKSWSQEAASLFKCLVNMQLMYPVILMESSDDSDCSLPVLLLDCQNGGRTINELMVELGYAVSFSPIDGALPVLQNPEIEESSCREVPSVSAVSSHSDSDDTCEWNPMSEDYHSEMNTLYHDDEDPCYVVTGYKPQDERRVCKFYSQKGWCFKGETCQKEHIDLDPDGWTTDREMIFTKSFSEIVLPDVQHDIMVQVTHVTAVNRFYAVICDEPQSHCDGVQIKRIDVEDEDDEREESLITLNNYMNEKCNVKALQRCDVMPALGQIVVARFSQDHRFYRARVLDYSDMEFHVFFVDHGNTEWVNESNIRVIEPKYLHLPFQAIECVLANVDNISESLEAKLFVARLVHNKTLHARVIAQVHHLSRLEILLWDENGYDVGASIIQRGYGRERVVGIHDLVT